MVVKSAENNTIYLQEIRIVNKGDDIVNSLHRGNLRGTMCGQIVITLQKVIYIC